MGTTWGKQLRHWDEMLTDLAQSHSYADPADMHGHHSELYAYLVDTAFTVGDGLHSCATAETARAAAP